MKRIFCLITVMILIAISTSSIYSQTITSLKKIDASTWMWQKDSTLVIMKVAITKTDTIAKWHYYKWLRTDTRSHFNLKRFME